MWALGSFVVVAAVVVGWQLLSRRVTRLRRDRMPYGTGVWRATLEELDASEVMGGGGLGWMYQLVPVEVTVTGDRLTLVPGRGARTLGRFRACELCWDEVAGVVVGGRVHQVAGALRPVPLTRVTLLLVGERAADYLPLSDAEAAEAGLTATERAAEDAETRADAVALFGADHVPGTLPLKLFLDDPTDFAETVRRYAVGRRPR